jgi:hypothetical protein
VPVGTGLWIAGGNNNVVRNNHFWNNWRRGVMLFAVPDVLVCPPGTTDQVHGCDPAQVNTSYRNRFHGNVMSRSPAGVADRNGTDIWWDQFVGNTENCWHDNVGSAGNRASLTATPPLFVTAGLSVPGFLPEDCGSSIGTSGVSQEAELLGCFAAFEQGIGSCPWFTTPNEP